MPKLHLPLFIAALLCLITPPAHAQHILFVRGADRSGGFLEAGNDDSRTEHLAGIDNDADFRGNHGWSQLANLLTEHGYTLTQITETVEPGNTQGQSQGEPIDFASMDLSQYDAIVFGSNNARYTEAQVDAIEQYLREGGGAIFISDTNFGGDWADAPDSDRPFLERFGLTVNQDHGTYTLDRADGEFTLPDHPILQGVDTFDGEGVTPITVPADPADLPEGVAVQVLVPAQGQVRRNHAPFGHKNLGPTTDATPQDAALLTATIDQGRLVGFFDRNTFFNQHGAGTNLHRFNNTQLALNLFAWVTDNDGKGEGESTDH
ncbi:hypothetical protein OT109_04210 [Phycisphaeraceae bacterium D3-23]